MLWKAHGSESLEPGVLILTVILIGWLHFSGPQPGRPENQDKLKQIKEVFEGKDVNCALKNGDSLETREEVHNSQDKRNKTLFEKQGSNGNGNH